MGRGLRDDQNGWFSRLQWLTGGTVWGDGGSPHTSSIIVLTCISGLEPDVAKLTNAGLVSGFLLQVAPIQAKAI